MTKTTVTYKAGEGDPVSTKWRGRTFVHDQPVEVDSDVAADAELINAATGNPSFNVGDEDKAKLRDEAKNKQDVVAAEAQLAQIDNEAHEMEERHTREAAAMEQRHQHERDAFLNKNEPTAIELRRTIRGSDGSDDQHPVDESLPQHSDLAPQDGKPTPVELQPGSPTDPNGKTQQENEKAKETTPAAAETPLTPPAQPPLPPATPAPAAATGGDPVKA